jgi:hypothetical protein
MEDIMATQTLAIRSEETSPFFTAIDEAERCRRNAHAMVAKETDRLPLLTRQPSSWCVVTEDSGNRAFHAPHQQSALRDRLEKGHKVILTLGIIGDPRASLTKDNHLVAMKVSEECMMPSGTLAVIIAHAKIHALSSIHR